MESSEDGEQHTSFQIQSGFTDLHLENALDANPAIRDYVKEAKSEGPTGNEAWVSKPEIPSSEEILGTDLPEDDDDCVELMPNHINGPWPSKESYLRAHYELLREDSVAPLRDAVAYVRDEPQMIDSKSVSVYEKAHINGITFSQRGIAFRIQFSTRRAGKNIAWEYSKRLIAGTAIALSPASDCFRKECVVAIVAARPLEGVKLQPPEIDIFFARPEEVDFDPHQEWMMVEARSGYYESSRHTMLALQKMSKERFPLAEHICSLRSTVEPPEYTKERPVLDIGPGLSKGDEEDFENRVNILDSWPQLPTGDLDDTQWAALHQILTKRLSIIQGPPGTGKTFVSVVALKIMLSNMKTSDPPIFIAAQTNHALDQLLTHISSFESNYIRLGARSSDAEIKKQTLFAIRQKEPTTTVQGSTFGSSRKKYRNLIATISELLQVFSQEESSDPLPSTLFLKSGTLTGEQYESLEKGARGWVRPGAGDDIDPLAAWLGEEGVGFQVKYVNESFGFSEDEIDPEFEQLKELEAEQGLEEDDYDALKGQFNIIRDPIRGRNAGSVSDAAALDYLKCMDLWKIPTKARGAVYNVLRKLTKEHILKEFRNLLAQYSANCEDLQIGKWEADHTILRNAKVIGMTTTGLSKYRPLLSSLNPKVVLIEEAAEVIEAPISAACFNSLQHLILVGDHQQLRGHCAVPELGDHPFYLDISMFERLVRNNMAYVTLKRQRRMVPEIRRLLGPIYGELKDHPSVEQHPSVPGMGGYRAYFFSHPWPENNDSMLSKFNEIEALMVVGFYTHLVLNGVSANNITVLTFYNGQRKRLLKMLRNNRYLQGSYVKVVTVDSYQGEENDVVILSLVRSGKNNNIGFLNIENRVCVALSRAKMGLYMFGNSLALTFASDLWQRVISVMADDSTDACGLGFGLPLTCSMHKRTMIAKDPSFWERTNGGCDWYCNGALRCGHKCTMRCHSMSHDQIMCNRSCSKTMACGHVCDKPCSVTHVCSCAVDQTDEVTYNDRIKEDQATELVNVYDIEEKELQHKKMVSGYRDFANGKAQEQDARLHAQATAGEKEKSKKFVTKLSLVEFLDDDAAGNDSNPVHVPSSGSSDRVGDSESHGFNQSVPQGNLLD